MSKCLTKHMRWFCFGISVKHKLMCFAYIFRKNTFTRNKTGQEEQKGSEKRKKHWKKIRFYFCIEIMPWKDGGGV